MRKFFCNRFTVLTMISTGFAYYPMGEIGIGHFCEVSAAALWLIGGCPRLWRSKPKPVPQTGGLKVAEIVVPRSNAPGRGGVPAMYRRLDPAWQRWLAAQPKVERISHDR